MRPWRAAITLLALVASLPAAAQEKWVRYSDPAQGFEVEFPQQPRTASTPVKGRFPLTNYKYQFATDNGTFNVSVMAFNVGAGPVTNDPGYLTRLIASYARGVGGTVRAEKAVSLAGKPAMEAVADDVANDRYHLIDILATTRRVYLVVSEGPKGHETSPDALRFRDSFKLTGP